MIDEYGVKFLKRSGFLQYLQILVFLRAMNLNVLLFGSPSFLKFEENGS